MTAMCDIFQHILEHEAWINPRSAWCCADEDLERILKEIALRCHARNTPSTVLYKWVLSIFDY